MTGPGTLGREPSDIELAQAYCRGNMAAMEILVARHERALMGYLRGKSGSLEEAQDAFQETWLRAIRHMRSFRRGSFRAWLTTIARNLVIDRVRRKKPTVSLDAHGEGQLSWGDKLASSVKPPDADLLAQDAGDRIARGVHALPPEQREVFLLRTQQEMSFAEIASLLNIPVNTALGRMHYAVAKLRKELEDLL